MSKDAKLIYKVGKPLTQDPYVWENLTLFLQEFCWDFKNLIFYTKTLYLVNTAVILLFKGEAAAWDCSKRTCREEATRIWGTASHHARGNGEKTAGPYWSSGHDQASWGATQAAAISQGRTGDSTEWIAGEET